MSQRASHTPIELHLNQPKPSRKTMTNSQGNSAIQWESSTLPEVVGVEEEVQTISKASSCIKSRDNNKKCL